MAQLGLTPRKICLVFALIACGLTSPLQAAWPPSMPDASQLFLEVDETANIERGGEIVTSGVPLPRSFGITSTAGLAVVNGSNQAIPAEFRILARWNAGLDQTTAPIQWLLISFPAGVVAGGTLSYRLVVDGSVANPPPPVSLQLSQNGNQVTVDTGAATFVLGGNPHSLFDELRTAGGTLVAGGGAMSARLDGQNTGHNGLRGVSVEWSGPLTAVVQIRGTYDLPAVGGGGIASLRRYVFQAGSPTALIRQSIAWEGSRCGLGEISCGNLNGLLLESWRNQLNLNLSPPFTVEVATTRSLSSLAANLPAGSTASVRQLLRSSRLAPKAFSANLGATTSAGIEADSGMLSVAKTGVGSVAIALRDFHRYEPQALRLLADGSLAFDLADNTVYLGARQGLFANFAVNVMDGPVLRAALDRFMWAPLNRPLRAWPSARWWAASQAVEEVPVGTLPADLADYDVKMPAVLANTLSLASARGLHGLATHGLFPRYWGDPLLSDEIDCGLDPTPGSDWDDVYWCSTWADYHNAAATAPKWAFRSGEVRWLDEIAAPAAWRMLHTVVQQCAPGDPFFYCGQAPTGYGGYRSDNNGSHAYFDNLILHYWLTGDETIVQTLRRGADTMRGFNCPGRADDPPGPVCGPTTPLSDPWIALNGRGGSQWYRVFRFLGLADDPTYLDDARSGIARWLTQYWAQPGTGSATRGFTVPAGGGSFDFIDGPGTYQSDQLWMASLYDFDVIDRLIVDEENAPLGSPAISPATAELAWARSLRQIGSATPWSTGTPQGPWPNVVGFTFSGNRIGGTLTSLAANHINSDGDATPCELCEDDGDADPQTCADVCLYDTGKACLGAVLARAGDRAQDAGLQDLGRAFAVFGLNSLGTTPQPLNKATGITLSRLHAAVARATAVSAEGAIFANGFESGNTSGWSQVVP